MKKVLKWVGIAFVCLIVLGTIINATKSPEQKAAEATAREQEQAKQTEYDVKQADKKREQSIQDSVPKCDSSAAKDALKNAFDQSQFARTMNLSAIEVSATRENTFDSLNKTRTCSGAISMNNTEKANVDFKVESRTNEQFLLTFEVVERPQTSK